MSQELPSVDELQSEPVSTPSVNELQDTPSTSDLQDVDPKADGAAKRDEATQHLGDIRSGKVHADLNDAYQTELTALAGKSFAVRMHDKIAAIPTAVAKMFYGEQPAAPGEPPKEPFSLKWGLSDKPEDYGDIRKQAEDLGTMVKSIPAVVADLPASAVDIAATLAHAPVSVQGLTEEGMNLIPSLRSETQKRTAQDYALADTLRGRVEEASNKYAEKVGLDRESFMAQVMTQVPYFLIPGGELELGSAIDSAIGNVARIASKGKIIARAGVAAVTPAVAEGSKIGAAAALAELGLPHLGVPHGTSAIIGAGYEAVKDAVKGALGMGSTKPKLGDKIFKALSGLTRKEAQERASVILKAAREDPSSIMGEDALTTLQTEMDKRISGLGEEVANHRSNLKADDLIELDKKKSDGSWMRPTEELKGEAKLARTKQEAIDDISDKLDGIGQQTKFHRFLDDSGRYLSNVAGQTALASAIGEGFMGSVTPTGDTSTAGQGAMIGAGLGVLAAPFAAKKGMYSNRLAKGEAALIDRGQPLIPDTHLEGMDTATKRFVWKMAGAADGMGAKFEIVDGNSPKVKASETATPGNGSYDPRTNTIYINKDAIASGAPAHEFTHVTQQMFGDMLSNKSPEQMAAFEAEYRKAVGDPNFKFNSKAERDAEVGRVLLQNTPIEAFFGGEGAGDMLSRSFNTILGKIDPKWLTRHQVDPLFKTPFDQGDMLQMRARMFEAGELAAQKSPHHTASVPPEWIDTVERGLHAVNAPGDHAEHIKEAVRRLGGAPQDEQAIFDEAVRVAQGKPPAVPVKDWSHLQQIEAELMPGLKMDRPPAPEKPESDLKPTPEIMAPAVHAPGWEKPVYGFTHEEALKKAKEQGLDVTKAEKGFYTRDGVYLPTKQALDYGQDIGQLPHDMKKLTDYNFQGTREFMPSTHPGASKRFDLIFGGPDWIVRDNKTGEIAFRDKSGDGSKARKFAYIQNKQSSESGEAISYMPSVKATPEVKKFLGKSELTTDKEGNPIVMFHTSRAGKDFSTFDKSKNKSLGFHFGNIDQANYVADAGGGSHGPIMMEHILEGRKGTRTYPVILRLENPLVLKSDLGFTNPESTIKALIEDGYLGKATGKGPLAKILQPAEETTVYKKWEKYQNEEMVKLPHEASGHPSIDNERRAGHMAIERILKEDGYDGFVYPNEFEGVEKGKTSYAVFDANQIKSAMVNSGDYNFHNPRIDLMPKAEVNIGLNVGDKEGLLPNDVVKALEDTGVKVTRFVVDRPKGEEAKVVATLDKPMTKEQGDAVAKALHQDAIPQHVGGGKGEMFGAGNPEHPEWNEFNPDYFTQHNGKSVTDNMAAGHDGEPIKEGQTGSPGMWDTMMHRKDLGEELGVPGDKRFYEQKPDARKKITDHFKNRGEAQFMPKAEREVPDRFYAEEQMGHRPAIIDRLTGKVVDRWEGPDAGEYSSTAGYSSPHEMAAAMNEDMPPLPKGWTGSHPDAFIPEIIRKHPDGTWGIEGKDGKIEGKFDTSDEANAALKEAQRGAADPASPQRIQLMPHVPETPEFKKFFKDSKVVDEGGKPLVLFHGTTHDFDTFDPSKSSPEGFWGKGIYLTTDPKDASKNYATPKGPDIVDRIERLKEQLANTDGIDELSDSQLLDMAKKQLLGPHKGAIIPVAVSMKNPVEIGGKKPTYWEDVYPTDEAGGFIDEAPTGDLVNFEDGLAKALRSYDIDSEDAHTMVNDLRNQYPDGGKAGDILEHARNYDTAMEWYDENGDLAGTEIIRQAVENMGHDGIIQHTAGDRFSNMGLAKDAKHVIAFRPEQLKSVIGNTTFDSNKPSFMMMPKSESEAQASIREGREQFPESYPRAYKRDKEGNLKMVKNQKTKILEAEPVQKQFNIRESPLYKKAGNDDAFVEEMSNRLAKEHDEKYMKDPDVKAYIGWYRVKKMLMDKGLDDAESSRFIDLLAATSGRQEANQQFVDSLEAHNRFLNGDYDQLIQDYLVAQDKFNEGTLTGKYKVGGKEFTGPIDGPRKFSLYLDANNLLPLKASGKKFGMHSGKVLKVLTDQFSGDVSGLKYIDFKNAMHGTSVRPVVDIWSYRSLDRLAHEGEQEPWRRLPENEPAVPDADYELSSRVMQSAADKLGYRGGIGEENNPTDLQAMNWVNEKKEWLKRGWSDSISYGDYRPLIERMEPTKDKQFKLREKES